MNDRSHRAQRTKRGSAQQLSSRWRIGMVALAAGALVVGAVALMVRAPAGSLEWWLRLLALIGIPLGFVGLALLLGPRLVRDDAQRTMALYGGLVGIAFLAAFRQITAPIYLDVGSYQPVASGYVLTHNAELDELAGAALQASNQIGADRVRVFVASQESHDVALVVAVDMRRTDVSTDDLRDVASGFTQAVVANGATEADPIVVDGEQVLVFEVEGERLAFWLRQNLMLVVSGEDDHLEPLVIALHSD